MFIRYVQDFLALTAAGPFLLIFPIGKKLYKISRRWCWSQNIIKCNLVQFWYRNDDNWCNSIYILDQCGDKAKYLSCAPVFNFFLLCSLIFFLLSVRITPQKRTTNNHSSPQYLMMYCALRILLRREYAEEVLPHLFHVDVCNSVTQFCSWYTTLASKFTFTTQNADFSLFNMWALSVLFEHVGVYGSCKRNKQLGELTHVLAAISQVQSSWATTAVNSWLCY